MLGGLRGPVEVVGRPPVRWALAERMAYHKVPGVFVMSTLGWTVTFTRDASGRATGLSVSREIGPPIEGARVR